MQQGEASVDGGRAARRRAYESGEWDVVQLRAARRTAECFGGWEYLVQWGGEHPDSWEPATSLPKRHFDDATLERAQRGYRFAMSFEEFLEWAQDTGSLTVRATARRALETCRSKEEGNKGWATVFKLFREYAKQLRGDGRSEAANLEETVGAKGGCGLAWQPDPFVTWYEGDKEMRETVVNGKKEMKAKSVAGLGPSAAWEQALAPDLRVDEHTIERMEEAR